MGDMELVTVNTRFQIVIPPEIRNRANVVVGDLLEAKIEDGKITLTPQSLLDKHLAEATADIAAGPRLRFTDSEFRSRFQVSS